MLVVLIAVWPHVATADPISEARQAQQASQYRRAIALVRPLAEKGDPRAQHVLGDLYKRSQVRSGLSLNEEMRRAIVWFEKAAAQGYKPAIRDLGNILMRSDKGAQRGYDMLLGLARSGGSRAQALLGQFIANHAGEVNAEGFRVPGTAADGLKWLHRAAHQTDIYAVMYLARWHIRHGKATDAYFWQLIDAVMEGTNRMMGSPDIRKKLTKEQIASVERRAAAWLEAHGYKFRRPDPAKR
jgi:uncharacterized protein